MRVSLKLASRFERKIAQTPCNQTITRSLQGVVVKREAVQNARRVTGNVSIALFSREFAARSAIGILHVSRVVLARELNTFSHHALMSRTAGLRGTACPPKFSWKSVLREKPSYLFSVLSRLPANSICQEPNEGQHGESIAPDKPLILGSRLRTHSAFSQTFSTDGSNLCGNRQSFSARTLDGWPQCI